MDAAHRGSIEHLRDLGALAQVGRRAIAALLMNLFALLVMMSPLYMRAAADPNSAPGSPWKGLAVLAGAEVLLASACVVASVQLLGRIRRLSARPATATIALGAIMVVIGLVATPLLVTGILMVIVGLPLTSLRSPIRVTVAGAAQRTSELQAAEHRQVLGREVLAVVTLGSLVLLTTAIFVAHPAQSGIGIMQSGHVIELLPAPVTFFQQNSSAMAGVLAIAWVATAVAVASVWWRITHRSARLGVGAHLCAWVVFPVCFASIPQTGKFMVPLAICLLVLSLPLSSFAPTERALVSA